MKTLLSSFSERDKSHVILLVILIIIWFDIWYDRNDDVIVKIVDLWNDKMLK